MNTANFRKIEVAVPVIEGLSRMVQFPDSRMVPEWRYGGGDKQGPIFRSIMLTIIVVIHSVLALFYDVQVMSPLP